MLRMRTFGLVCLLFIYTSFSSVFADTIDRDDSVEDFDVQALREWMNTKRQVTIKEKGGNLALSAEVRAELQAQNETVNGVKQRGRGAPKFGGTTLPTDNYDIEVNVMLDYRADRGWASIKLEFDNDAGIFYGTLNKLKLEKGYFGVRLIDADNHTFDFEAGRRRLSTAFDSNLEFNSFMDGILFKYDAGFEYVGDFYVHLGAFVIDERNDHYGYLGELGLLNIANSGFYTKYSLTDWNTKDLHNRINDLRFDFLVSQLILGYRCLPKALNKQVKIYLAGLYNHSAHRLKITDYKRSNFGGYLGFSIGETKKKGDWALDVNYQLLAAQAVPDFDVSGISIGNTPNAGFYTTAPFGTPASAPTTRKTAAGNGNYRGFVITLDYLLTNNLNLQQQWEQSVTLDTSIGPFRRFKQYEIEFIYGF